MSADGNVGETEAAVAGQLPENTVEYMLFVVDNQQVEARKARSRLETIRKKVVELVHSLTKDYIWQREGFEISFKSENGLLFLHGTTDYGDAIEDEWLIVYMLCELSKAHSDLWVRVGDSDGEFLLVEAANVLPSWLSPEIDHYRVWIHLGKIFLIPLNSKTKDQPSVRSQEEEQLSLSQAVTFLRSNADALVHLPAIDSEAFHRLKKYPQQISNSIHHSLVTIPRAVAYIVRALPKSIAPVVERFYLRDANSLKPILSSSAPLEFPPEDFVTVSVRFSKTLYAQLKSQRFETPPRWESVFRTTRNENPSSNEEQKRIERLETGMKLTCGLEMLAKDAENNKSRVVREMAIVLEDLQEDGSSVLPSDDDIKLWDHAGRDDDDSWLDINYEDFERELEGKQAQASSKGASGFGEAQTQENLRKIVSRFEAFLNDDSAGLDGAELDRMDFDNDDEEEYDGDDQDEEVNFDEEAFSRMMREMMGFTTAATGKEKEAQGSKARAAEEDSGSEDDSEAEEDGEIQDLASRMEAELREYGTLQLDPPTTGRAIKSKESSEKGKGKEKEQPLQERSGHSDDDDDDDDDDEEEVDIDYNLAKNLLESFKSQGGMAGPAGNLMGLMGFQLPRDEDSGSEGGH
ncbi:SGT1 domain-containing protein [Trichoderma austrokoningii]